MKACKVDRSGNYLSVLASCFQQTSGSSCNHSAAGSGAYYHIRIFSVLFTTFYSNFIAKSLNSGDTEW